MSGSLRFKTIESSKDIVRQLYLKGDDFFTCTIKVPSPRLDTVEEGTLQLDLKRMGGVGHSYEISNGDRIYRTRARFTGDIWEFQVDVISRSREADLVGATISVGGEALEIFKRISER